MICALILAAGRSQRMGAQKLLLPVAGLPMISCVVDAFPHPPVDEVFVVVRPGEAGIRTALAGRRVNWVENSDSSGEMLSSVRCGLSALPVQTQTILVTPGDLPGLTAGLITAMLAAFPTAERSILVPVHAGKRGHPLVFSAAYRDEILTLYDGTGLRGLLQAHPGEVTEWPAPTSAILHDVDTPDDYRKITSQ